MNLELRCSRKAWQGAFWFSLITVLLALALLASQLSFTTTSSRANRPGPKEIPVSGGKYSQRDTPAPVFNSAIPIRSPRAMVQDCQTGEIIYCRNADEVVPVASITKLMMAMVLLDAREPMEELITITEDDMDLLKGSKSRLPVKWTVCRRELLLVALMSSENRAASALARTFPGGRGHMVAAMNRKAMELGMDRTHFDDPTGLSPANVSTARDLCRMVAAALRYRMIREMTTANNERITSYQPRRSRIFGNSNPLIHNPRWRVELSKTGYITESGFSLAMSARVESRQLIMVFLGADGRMTRYGDAARIRNWLLAEADSLSPAGPPNSRKFSRLNSQSTP